VQISNALYGAIWGKATEQDDSVEDILRRLLGLPKGPSESPGIGFYDRRNSVRFAEGFKIFRNYKGIDHFAIAHSGRWYLDGKSRPYSSLAALSEEIGAKTENAWFGWRYEDEDGKVYFISNLRDPKLIRERARG